MNNKEKKSIYRQKSVNKKEERGIALIMTLGILSMLLVLALAFASNARTTRKIASSNANITQARLIAEAGLDRVLAIAKITGNNPAGTTSVNPDGPTAFNYTGKYNDFIYNISMNDIIGTEIYQWENTHPVEWINVTSAGKIVGRFAYKVIGNAGVIDPSATVTHDADANTNWGVAGAEDENGLAEERFGVNVYEMNLGNLDPGNALVSSGLTATHIQGFSSDAATPPGALPDGSRWADFSTMFTDIGIIDLEAKKTCERDWLALNTSKDPEAFWVDSGSPGDGIIDAKTELYHRFNLRQFTDVAAAPGVAGVYDPGHDDNWWDSATVASLVGSNRAAWDSGHTSTDATGGINWLNDITNLPQATFDNATNRRDQIVANLIDYCDTDDIPTSDVDPTTPWDASNIPTYTGNEKTPYINEIGVTVKCLFDVSDPDDPDDGMPYLRTATLTFEMEVEVINIYNEPLPGNTIVTILDGNFDGTYKYGTGGYTNDSSEDPDEDFTGKTFAIPPMAANSYKTLSINWIGEPYDLPIASVDSVGLKDLNVTINKVLLNYDGNNVDYANINTTLTVGDLGGQVGLGNSGMKYAFFSFQAKDPRQNLNEGDWNANFDLNPAGYTTYGDFSSLGANSQYGTHGDTADHFVNYQADPSASAPDGNDVETISDPKDGISTAFIANDLMVSPWELGAIHRGAAWQTLNLSTYNPSLTMKKYTDVTGVVSGDGNILDQIKMTDDIDVYGKFNANTANKDCLRLLTMGIYTGNGYLDPTNTGGSIITKTIANALADSINDATDHQTWKRRSQILNAIELSDGTAGVTQDTDAQKEEIIGKFINLCKTSTENVSTADVIIVAQAIKDIGGVTINKDLDFDGDVAGADESTGLDFDGDGLYTTTGIDESITTTLGKYDLNGDEILSEVKILAKIYYDTTDGKWRVSKYIFADK